MAFSGNEPALETILRFMLEVEYDAIAAYTAAIDRLEDLRFRGRFEQFLGEHQRHARELDDALRQLGGMPPSGPGARAMLTQDKVVIGTLSDDLRVLRAMRANEDETNLAYDQALERVDLPADVEAVLRRNAEDERRHRRFIEGEIAILTAPGSRAAGA